MNTRLSRGIGLSALVIFVGCGARVEIRDSEYTTGGGGFGLSGSTGTGEGAGSNSSTSSGSGGMTGSSSGGMTGSSSGGMTGSSSGGMTGSSSGGMTGSSSGGGIICPGFGDICTECLSAQCADIYCACYKNPHCFQLSGCTNGCNGNDTCEQQCYAMYPNGASDLYALSSCGGMNCKAECPGTEPLDPCSQCMVETCGDELDACFAFAPCINLYECLDGCPPVDLACQQKCYNDFGDGVPKLQTLLGCTQMKCPDC